MLVVAGAEMFEVELVAEVEIEVVAGAGAEMFAVVAVTVVDNLAIEIEVAVEVVVETMTGLAEMVEVDIQAYMFDLGLELDNREID
jgi:hypothetical protein